MSKNLPDKFIPNQPIIVYGPQGCGKTTHAKALAEFFKKETIIDGWNSLTDGKPSLDALYLTSDDMSSSSFRYTIPFHVATKIAGIDISNYTDENNYPRRYCKDCVYCEGSLRWDPECTAPESRVYDLVRGPTKRFCRQMRTDQRLCGSAGFFYAFKPVI